MGKRKTYIILLFDKTLAVFVLCFENALVLDYAPDRLPYDSELHRLVSLHRQR